MTPKRHAPIDREHPEYPDAHHACVSRDVGAERFADLQPVHLQRDDQRLIAACTNRPGLYQQAAELVAIQAEGAGLVVDLRVAHVCCRVLLHDPFDMAVAVEAAQRRQAASW
jgi:hypothetical protein